MKLYIPWPLSRLLLSSQDEKDLTERAKITGQARTQVKFNLWPGYTLSFVLRKNADKDEHNRNTYES